MNLDGAVPGSDVPIARARVSPELTPGLQIAGWVGLHPRHTEKGTDRSWDGLMILRAQLLSWDVYRVPPSSRMRQI